MIAGPSVELAQAIQSSRLDPARAVEVRAVEIDMGRGTLVLERGLLLALAAHMTGHPTVAAEAVREAEERGADMTALEELMSPAKTPEERL